jgi:hypothetical protein
MPVTFDFQDAQLAHPYADWLRLRKMGIVKNRNSLRRTGQSLQRLPIENAARMGYTILVIADVGLRRRNQN